MIKTALSAALFLLFLCVPSIVFSAQLTILTENSGRDNYQDQDGNVKGHNVEIVREILKRLNLDAQIEMVPWSRGYAMLQTKPNVCLFSTVRTVERENMFKWVGPLHVTKFVLYKKKNAPIVIPSLEDAKKVKNIGCYKDDVRERILIEKGFTNLRSLYGSDANLRN